MAEELLSSTQASARLGVSPRTLDGWRVRGGGPPFVRLSARAIRYRPEDLDRFISERLRANTSATVPPTENAGILDGDHAA